MKKLSMVIHSSLQQELADFLRALNIDMFMFSHIEEHGLQQEHDPLLSARDRVVGYVPKVRIDVILEGEQIQSLLEEIKKAPFSLQGKAFYWVSELQEAGEI